MRSNNQRRCQSCSSLEAVLDPMSPTLALTILHPNNWPQRKLKSSTRVRHMHLLTYCIGMPLSRVCSQQIEALELDGICKNVTLAHIDRPCAGSRPRHIAMEITVTEVVRELSCRGKLCLRDEAMKKDVTIKTYVQER